MWGAWRTSWQATAECEGVFWCVDGGEGELNGMMWVDDDGGGDDGGGDDDDDDDDEDDVDGADDDGDDDDITE